MYTGKMQISTTPFDPVDLFRQPVPVPQSARDDRAAAAARDGADAQQALSAKPRFDQAVRDKAQRLSEGEKPASARDSARRSGGDPGELTPEEEQKVRELKKRDQEVRQHEQAHARAAGPYGGQPQYQYVRGPDGKQYAVSGEVKIDTSEESSPEATIAKMEIVIRAALAPADPSAQDRQVASEAKQKKAEAQAELRTEKQEERAAALKRQQERVTDPAAAGLPDNVAQQASAAYASASSLLGETSRSQSDVEV